MKQLIAFRRLKVYTSNDVPSIPSKELMREIVTISQELKKIGYRLSEEAIGRLSEKDLIGIHNEVIQSNEWRNDRTGYSVLYPGFPQQVIDLADFELWENARKIYDKEVNIDDFIDENRKFYTQEEIEKEPNLKVLKPMSESEFMKIPTEICSAGNSIGPAQKEELKWFIGEYPDLVLPTRIPFKETLCIVMSLKKEYCPQDINDILRYSIYIMGGDPSLPSIPKKIKANSWSKSSKVPNPNWRKLGTLSRLERKHILSLIEEMVNKKGLGGTIPDAKGSRFYGSWMLLNERLHAGDYRKKYKKAAEFFYTLLTPSLCSKYKTWNSKVQEMYDKKKDLIDITKFISDRPGELVRRLDSLLRRGMKENREGDVFDIFLTCEGMKNKTLLELISYYDKAKYDSPRLIKIMGRSGLYTLPPKEKLESDFIEVVQSFIHRKILINIDSRITEKDLDGKLVVLDPEIRKIPIPRDMRNSASYIPRGTEFNIPEEKNIVAFFVQWVQESRPEDLDLHGYLCNDSNKGSNIGWNTGLKGEGLCAIHSGDVLNRPGKCQETIVFDIQKCLENGYKYIVGDICNYKGRGFNTLDCHSGYTFLNDLKAVNEDTVTENPEYMQELNSESSNIATFMINLEKRTIMFLEVEINNVPTFDSRQGSYYINLVKYFTAPQTFTSYEIMEQHFKSRGALVIPEMPIQEEDKELVAEAWMVDDVVQDYTKILGMIGE